MEFIGIVLLGIASGWVINYLADTLPLKRRLSGPICLNCHEALAWQEYFLMRACPHCEAKRSLRTWIVLCLTPVVALFLYLFPPARLGFWIGFGLIIYFAIIAVIDIEYRAILLIINILGGIIGLLIGLKIRSVTDTLLGGVAGFVIMLGLYYFGILFNRLIGRIRKIEVEEVALGLGDVYLMGGLGLMLGWPEVVGGMLIAILLGGIVSGLIILVSWLVRRYRPMQAIPYAPFLIIAAIIMIYIPKQ
ncbi:MAG TPA: prepilin peptidase [Anaerolineaceae bacterium]|nr:prepilin peptidase [Anaerolineaceae bacterium]